MEAAGWGPAFRAAMILPGTATGACPGLSREASTLPHGGRRDRYTTGLFVLPHREKSGPPTSSTGRAVRGFIEPMPSTRSVSSHGLLLGPCVLPGATGSRDFAAAPGCSGAISSSGPSYEKTQLWTHDGGAGTHETLWKDTLCSPACLSEGAALGAHVLGQGLF